MFERLGTLPDTISAHAPYLWDERINDLASDMYKHPEDYEDLYEVINQYNAAAKAVEEALGDRAELLEELTNMFNGRRGAEQAYIYKLGFMDGGRVYHDFATHKLPKRKKHRGRRRP